MKAFEAKFTKLNGSNEITLLVGANSLSAAAKKAEETEEKDGTELVSVTLTDKVIL